MSEDPVSICPECGGLVRRMIGGGTGIIFKGSGFYVTDSKKASAASTASKVESAKKGTGSDKKSEVSSGMPTPSPSVSTDSAAKKESA